MSRTFDPNLERYNEHVVADIAGERGIADVDGIQPPHLGVYQRQPMFTLKPDHAADCFLCGPAIEGANAMRWRPR